MRASRPAGQPCLVRPAARPWGERKTRGRRRREPGKDRGEWRRLPRGEMTGMPPPWIVVYYFYFPLEAGRSRASRPSILSPGVVSESSRRDLPLTVADNSCSTTPFWGGGRGGGGGLLCLSSSWMAFSLYVCSRLTLSRCRRRPSCPSSTGAPAQVASRDAPPTALRRVCWCFVTQLSGRAKSPHHARAEVSDGREET